MFRYSVTMVASLAALFIHLLPGASEAFELDFAAVQAGEFWRVLTGHWTHFNADHLVWDLLMFTVLSIVCERRAECWYPALLVGIAVVVSVGVFAYCPQIHCYRGLSGLDTGLFAWIVVDWIASSLRAKKNLTGCLGLAMIVGLIGKLVYEWLTGETIFVKEGDFVPLVEAHLTGAAVGVAIGVVGVALVQFADKRADQRQSCQTAELTRTNVDDRQRIDERQRITGRPLVKKRFYECNGV